MQILKSFFPLQIVSKEIKKNTITTNGILMFRMCKQNSVDRPAVQNLVSTGILFLPISALSNARQS
jgi:hypothetical protein